jgi:hypothetical protein
MLVLLTISSEFTPQQRKAYDRIEREEADEETKVKAANAIKFSVKVRNYLKERPFTSEKLKAKHISIFKEAIIAQPAQSGS